jgi:hypothetical protein
MRNAWVVTFDIPSLGLPVTACFVITKVEPSSQPRDLSDKERMITQIKES